MTDERDLQINATKCVTGKGAFKVMKALQIIDNEHVHVTTIENQKRMRGRGEFEAILELSEQLPASVGCSEMIASDLLM